jgi:hypothetical protein
MLRIVRFVSIQFSSLRGQWPALVAGFGFSGFRVAVVSESAAACGLSEHVARIWRCRVKLKSTRKVRQKNCCWL